MLPLAYNREIKKIFFFYKAIHSYIVIDVGDYVTFNNHPSTRRGQTAGYYLTIRAYKPDIFQTSYFVRIVRLWNNVCSIASPAPEYK